MRIKLKKHQIANHEFEIDVIDNPRKNAKEFGPMTCHLCKAQSA